MAAAYQWPPSVVDDVDILSLPGLARFYAHGSELLQKAAKK